MSQGDAGTPSHIVRPDDAERAPYLNPSAVAVLADHPNFERSMRMALLATVDLYRGHWVLRRLANDRGRFLTGLIILDLHFIAGGGEGFTVAQLRKEATAHGICSPGRITALVASLRLFGLLQVAPANDRRLRLLVPTERLLALHRERWQCYFTAIALIRPEAEAALPAFGHPAFLGQFAHALVGTYRGGLRLFDLMPELRPAAERDGGMVVLCALAVADADNQSVSITDLARRFSISRAHVLTILREAEQAGLARSAGPRGGYSAGPTLMDSLRRFIATMFLIQLAGLAATGWPASTIRPQ
jgi:hypothetical protein